MSPLAPGAEEVVAAEVEDPVVPAMVGAELTIPPTNSEPAIPAIALTFRVKPGFENISITIHVRPPRTDDRFAQ